MKRFLSQIRTLPRRMSRSWRSRRRDDFDVEEPLTHVVAAARGARWTYSYCLWYFDNEVPLEVRRHREYFSKEGRGFGEDAFHSMWWKLFSEFKPVNCLEIGVYRGQTLTLWQLIGDIQDLGVNVWGLSPLNSSGDSVSEYGSTIDYEADVAANAAAFNLSKPQIFQGFSQDSESTHFVNSTTWDLIYVDGSHEEEVVKSDVRLAHSSLKPNGLLVMDDANLYGDYKPFSFAFAGHPGPSFVAGSTECMEGFRRLGSVGHNVIFQRL